MPLVLVHFLVALLFTFFFVALYSAVSSQRSATQGLCFFAIVLFLACWAGGMWIMPFGPVWYGVSWMPFLAMGLFVAMLIAVAIPEPKRIEPRSSAEREKEASQALAILGGSLIVLLLAGIVAGYIFAPAIVE